MHPEGGSKMWIRVELNLRHHEKTADLASRLGEDAGPIPEGWLVRLWSVTMEREPDGRLDGWTPEKVERAVGWTGKAGTFYSAILESGFAHKTSNGIEIHDWREHNGQFLRDAERKRKSREKPRCPRTSTDVHGNPPDVTVRDGTGRDETERTDTYRALGASKPDESIELLMTFSGIWLEETKGVYVEKKNDREHLRRALSSGHPRDALCKSWRNFSRDQAKRTKGSQFPIYDWLPELGKWLTGRGNGLRDSLDLGDGRRMDFDLSTAEGRKKYNEKFGIGAET
jgi:hypothetical protein